MLLPSRKQQTFFQAKLTMHSTPLKNMLIIICLMKMKMKC